MPLPGAPERDTAFLMLSQAPEFRIRGEQGKRFLLYRYDKPDETEIFEEIIYMMHCFAMKMYSKRRKHKLEIVQEDLKNEISL